MFVECQSAWKCIFETFFDAEKILFFFCSCILDFIMSQLIDFGFKIKTSEEFFEILWHSISKNKQSIFL